MTVYVDRLQACESNQKVRWKKSCHLTADWLTELFDFAEKLGLKPGWIQKSRTGIAHFDLTERMRKKALGLGALER